MNLKTIVSTAFIVSFMTSGIAFAASSTPVASAAATTTPPTHKPPTPLPATKEAISKACSVQADAKNLHGKEREKFRFDCKKNGGKAI